MDSRFNHRNPVLRPAVAALVDAEGRLRDVAAKAAASGEYDALAVITQWAKTLRLLASEVNDDAATSASAVSIGETKPASSIKTKKSGKSATPGVPAFSRDGDVLVKTAQSRKSKNEYEHRASADVVLAVAECLSEWRPSRKLLTGEQLLEAYAKKKGAVVSYQVYAVLGWFTQIGLVRRHGRSGYSVPRPNTIVSDMRKAWDDLKNR